MKITVLLVDDAIYSRVALRRILESEPDFEVVGEAENGVEAIRKYKLYKPDVVLMDIVMPEKDGIEALRDIVELDPTARIIMCSAIGQEKMLTTAISLGAKDYVLKPPVADRIINSIRMVVGPAKKG
jgi:two-component system chemotaxis response regulator CheY